MSIIFKLKSALLDLIYPRQCVGCKRADTWLCETCFSLIKKSDQQCCYVCRNVQGEAKSCPDHFEKNPLRTLDRLLVSAHYSGNPLLKKVIHALKYERHPEDTADKLGLLLQQSFERWLRVSVRDQMVILPVPLHEQRLKERGFNQAELISRALEVQGEQRVQRSLIQRTRYTSTQVCNKTRQKRLENLRGAFEVIGVLDPTLIYLLVDDVTTTGSTLEECCEVLRKAGARQVWGLVLARN